jgi:hypothetical protein
MPSNGPSNGFAPIKIIKSKCHIKQKVWYIGNFMYMSFAAAVQGGSDKSVIFFFLLSNDTAQLKIIQFG